MTPREAAERFASDAEAAAIEAREHSIRYAMAPALGLPLPPPSDALSRAILASHMADMFRRLELRAAMARACPDWGA